MGKRKRSSQPPPSEETPPPDAEESSEGEAKVHVSRDVLAGSPDVFAPRSEKPAEVEAATPIDEEAGSTTAAEPPPAEEETSTELAATEAPAETTEAPPPPAVYVPPSVSADAEPARRAGSSIAFGVVLVVIGLFFLVVRVLDVDLSSYGWPLFIIIPGLTLIVVGFVSLGTGALIPGGIITMTGLILAYQNSTGDWPSWAYAWPLVAPGGVGLGMYLQGLRTRDVEALKQGRTLMFIAFLIFMIGFVIFETILNISGIDYGWFGKAALPALLIVIGVILLMRSIQRSRQA
ncbi:MAG TPA: hypothetical protein VGK42_13115 [Candidatus Dormibacteraeota bacterium]|jgi:hypothetical protein